MLKWFILCYFIFFCDALKSIVIKPGGVKGYYMMGICKYIRDHYDLTEYNYYGSSAGAWNILYLACNKEKESLFVQHAQELGQFSYYNLYDLENNMKKRLLNHFTMDDFDVSKIHICVSSKRNFFPFFKKNIVHEFDDLEDLIECCIASSHLPLITNGNFYYRFRNEKCIDGGIFKRPYRKNQNKFPSFILYPEIWKNKKIDTMNRMGSLDIHRLLYHGYNDAYTHKKELDLFFNE